ncbi:ribonuclease H-like domain-containing protein [Tanacetum coccineum]
MSIHNSDDGDDYIKDPVTLISKLDMSDPLHLHPNDSTALTVVSIKLKGTENYQVWFCAMLLALEGINKTGFIDGSCRRSHTYEVLEKQWDRVPWLRAFGENSIMANKATSTLDAIKDAPTHSSMNNCKSTYHKDDINVIHLRNWFDKLIDVLIKL